MTLPAGGRIPDPRLSANRTEHVAYRKDRLSHAVREVVSDAIANRVADPRVTRFTSITRVEISIDLGIANVYVSVMGSPTDERTTLQGLNSARGMIQSRLARQLDIRRCPAIRFHLDEQFKQGAQTLQRLDELREAIHKDPDRNAPDAPNAKNPEERSASHLEDGE